ncbi:MAG: hypothetical protein WDO15_00380 [Bacteroidota bacterium]
MRLTLILISALIISSLSVAQNLHVYEAAKTFFTTGKRVMIEDSLGLTTEFIIKEKGGISLAQRTAGSSASTNQAATLLILFTPLPSIQKCTSNTIAHTRQNGSCVVAKHFAVGLVISIDQSQDTLMI